MNVDVLVVGAGPAGLSAAAELCRLGAGRVLVADREEAAGGVPRHSWHTGYGLRDLRRVMTGPAYARALAGAAVAAGAELRLGTTVTGWGPGGLRPEDELVTVLMTSGRGVETVRAAAVLLATGCRERPRTARLIPGDRPSGVMTTGELQQRVYLGRERLPGRALVVGAEHVSFSAAMTLAHAGADVVALVTGYERQQSYAAFRLGAAVRWRVPVWTSTTVHRVTGRGGLEGVEVADVRTGAVRFVPCDTVVFTGDWIPDHELARAAGLAMDPGTRGPVVDTALATSVPRVFAAGNLVHAAETADIAAWSGRHAARHIAAALKDGSSAARPGSPASAAGTGPGRVPVLSGGEAGAGRVPVLVAPPLRWISPNAITSAAPPPLGRFVLRSQVFRRLVRLEVRQDGRLLARSRPVRLVPERPVHLGGAWLPQVNPAGGPVRVVTGSLGSLDKGTALLLGKAYLRTCGLHVETNVTSGGLLVLPTFVIGLREGLEAALIVGIIAAFLGQQGRRDALRQVWFGTAVAVAICIGVAIALQVISSDLPQRQQEGLETVVGALAVCMVTYMVVFMRKHARSMKKDLQGAAASALATGSSRALVVMAFLAVLREGFETAVFLLATFQASGDASTPWLGAVLGILLACAIGYGIYKGGVKLNMARFFRATGLVLVVVAAGLVMTAFHTAHEAGWLTVGQAQAFDLSWLVRPGTPASSLLTGVLGIQPFPVWIEVIAWLAYLVPMLLLVAWPSGPARQPRPVAAASVIGQPAQR